MKLKKAIKRYVKKQDKSARKEIDYILSTPLLSSVGGENKDLSEVSGEEVKAALGSLAFFMSSALDIDRSQSEQRAIKTTICQFFLDCEAQGLEIQPEALDVIKETWDQIQ